MNKVNRKNAFTLIEMLVVVVITGIILAIVLSSASNFMKNRDKRLYQVHMDVVEAATTNYINLHRGQLLSSNTSCFIMDYNILISDGLVKEGDINCTGSIIITKIASGNSFNKDYYLTCKEKNGEVVKTSANVPSGCTRFQ